MKKIIAIFAVISLTASLFLVSLAYAKPKPKKAAYENFRGNITGVDWDKITVKTGLKNKKQYQNKVLSFTVDENTVVSGIGINDHLALAKSSGRKDDVLIKSKKRTPFVAKKIISYRNTGLTVLKGTVKSAVTAGQENCGNSVVSCFVFDTEEVLRGNSQATKFYVDSKTKIRIGDVDGDQDDIQPDIAATIYSGRKGKYGFEMVDFIKIEVEDGDDD